MKSVILLSLALSTSPAAPVEDRVIGLLTLPDAFGTGPCDRFTPREVSLFATPDSSTVVGVIRVDRPWTFPPEGGCEGLTVAVHRRGGGPAARLPAEEYDYEAPAAIVLEQRGRWFRVRLNDGAAWVRASSRDEFHPLQRLLTDALTHMTDSWDGTVAPEPGAATRVQVPGDPRRLFVGYLVPQVQRVRVVLEAGGKPDSVRAHYRASAMSSRSGPNGTRILQLETGSSHPLFERPDRLAPVAGQVESNRCGAVLETIRPNQVPVFEQRAGWYQVARRSDDWRNAERLWLEDASVWRFHPVADDAERERLAVAAWGEEIRAVRVGGFREVADTLWVEVEILSHSPCGSVDEPSVRARGWIPAHSPSGAPTIWYSSRGC
ncbi:MAG TPA: hypothetical protein VMM18_12985 [Gemmatimonadaceae bacterium]|nr:hypothetical protein [Gemmatimonadaceae bacterium]